ncbi:MAG: nitrite/sulfite reductase [Lachnospiraceae bacterium]
MATDYAAVFREDLKEFHKMTKQFYNKEISVAQYKGFSGGFGSYAQRGGTASMLRLRLAGGEVTKDTLKFLADCIEKYHIDLIHLTTCQSIQFHNLSAMQVCNLIEEAFDFGIITRGGGGDYPRNVMCSPLSGVQVNESFDVLPYAKEAADYLLSFINKVTLPRKLKVCFSNNHENMTHASFRDLGFIANKNKTFDVYSAGGLGRNPRMGVKVAEQVEPNKILYYIKAMILTFLEYGNYQNRATARTRYMQETLGKEGYVKAYQKHLAQVLDFQDLDLTITPDSIIKTGIGVLEHPRAIMQKQSGLYSVSYHPIGGNPKPDFFQHLYELILPMEDVRMRITPEEGIYLINLTPNEARQVLALTEDGAKTLFETSVACIGASICQVGIGDSMHLLETCIAQVREENFPDLVLPKIHISGCPSSCSAHQIGALGFRGGVKQTSHGPKPAFAVFHQGCPFLGKEHFGEELGVMPQDEIPTFLVELGHAVMAAKIDYDSFITRYYDTFLKIVKKYI